jgi:hypothetical protein
MGLATQSFLEGALEEAGAEHAGRRQDSDLAVRDLIEHDSPFLHRPDPLSVRRILDEG